MVTEKKKNSAPKAAAAPKAASPKPEASTSAPTEAANGLHRRKVAVGVVVSDKMQKTIVVEVHRRVRHALYKKYVVRSCRFKAHDERNEAKMGDRVTIVESRPLSRHKRWVLQSILRKAGQVLEVSV